MVERKDMYDFIEPGSCNAPELYLLNQVSAALTGIWELLMFDGRIKKTFATCSKGHGVFAGDPYCWRCGEKLSKEASDANNR